MYLSRLVINPRSAGARRDLADPYDMHRTLTRAYVSEASQQPPRFLWRLEPQLSLTSAVVLVQSVAEPSWDGLMQRQEYLQAPVQIKRIVADDLLGMRLDFRFRLLANPTVSKEGKRMGLTSEPAQIEWLHRQGQRHGFAVGAAMVTLSDVMKSRRGDMLISVQRVCYEGTLQIIDAQRVAVAMVAGIGPAKAFGCGMLSLARR